MIRLPPTPAKLIPFDADRPPLTPYPREPGEYRFESEDQRASAPPGPGEMGRLNYGCPRGGGNCGGIRICNGAKPNSQKTWGWNGDIEAPTLTPSINCLARDPKTGEELAGCGWHGYLKEGVFTDA